MSVKRTRSLNIAGALDKLDGATVKSGWFEDAVYPDGTKVAEAAAFAELGTAKAPSRPILRPTIDEKEKVWVSTIKHGAKRTLNGKSGNFSEVLGLQVQGDIQATIVSIQSPPLSPSTVKARKKKLADGKTVGSLDKPLVETGYMLASVRSVVE